VTQEFEMVRVFLFSLAAMALAFGQSGAADKLKPEKISTPATITKVDAKKHSLTVTVKDKDNKESERMFKLTEEIRYEDSTGKVVALDVFANGDDVVVVEVDGIIKELHQKKKSADKKN
jgi:hypothetical protein